jgi:demethylmenaquinone methyltransferase / 2-methoxy-6-polyprenyl-1,4-benzoquinol methylase
MPRARKQLPGGEEKVHAVRSMFDAIAPRYDLVNRIMTFGMDRGWRRRAVEAIELPPGSLVVDVACGTGDFCRELSRAGHRSVGMDLSMGMLAAARADAPLVQADGLRMPLADTTIDGITCGFALRNVVDVGELMKECARVLRPGGRISLLEVAEPDSRVLRFGNDIYFKRVVPVIGGLLSDRDAYRYLPESTAYLPDRAGLVALIRNHGFPDARSDLVPLGVAQIITGTRA